MSEDLATNWSAEVPFMNYKLLMVLYEYSVDD